MEKIRAIIKPAGEPARIEYIENELETFNKLVGGWIQTFGFTDDTVIICNEEGKLLNLKPNIVIPCHGGYVEEIVGDIVIVNIAPADGEFHSVTDEDIEFIKSTGLIFK